MNKFLTNKRPENCDSPPFIDISPRLDSPPSQTVTHNTQLKSRNISEIQLTQLLHLPLTQSQTHKSQPDVQDEHDHASRSSDIQSAKQHARQAIQHETIAPFLYHKQPELTFNCPLTPKIGHSDVWVSYQPMT